MVCAACSRNARLSHESRANALSISQALRWAEQALQQQQVTCSQAIADEVRQRITAAGGEVDYVQLRDADNLHEVADAAAQPTLLAVAAWFPAKDRGTVRLIDNMVLGQMPS